MYIKRVFVEGDKTDILMGIHFTIVCVGTVPDIFIHRLLRKSNDKMDLQ